MGVGTDWLESHIGAAEFAIGQASCEAARINLRQSLSRHNPQFTRIGPSPHLACVDDFLKERRRGFRAEAAQGFDGFEAQVPASRLFRLGLRQHHKFFYGAEIAAYADLIER